MLGQFILSRDYCEIDSLQVSKFWHQKSPNNI